MMTWIYSSPTSISMYKYIHLHIDMGINSAVLRHRRQIRNCKTLINTFLQYTNIQIFFELRIIKTAIIFIYLSTFNSL